MASTSFDIDTGRDLDVLTDNLATFRKRFDRNYLTAVIAPSERLLDRLIRDRLQVEPPKRTRNSPPFIWSLNKEKQRKARAWMAINYPNGYTRTGKLKRGWQGDVTYRKNEVVVSVENKANASSYVYGNARYPQLIGHATTGWYSAQKVVADVVLDVAIEVEKLTTALVDSEIERL